MKWWVIGLTLFCTSAQAHDSWISRGGHKNKAGAWCCGDNDCHVEPARHASGGWVLKDGTVVPDQQTLPSEDRQIWVCRVPEHKDGTPTYGAIAGKNVRCVFVPYESF